MMQLIGHYSSPFVRRTAITAKFLGIHFEHLNLSVFSDYDEFRKIQPLVKVPTLVFDDGTLLVDSTLIIDYLTSISDAYVKLMPEDPAEHTRAMQHIGNALAGGEKGAQIIYESRRPADKVDTAWRERLMQQLGAALDAMEAAVAGADPWIFGGQMTQADITIAVVWRFVCSNEQIAIDANARPALSAHAERAEALPEFQAIQP